MEVDTKADPTRVPSAMDVTFDGNPLDLDRVINSCVIAHLLHPSSFADSTTKSVYLLQHFRGPALDWAGSILSKGQGPLTNYDSFVNRVRLQFGYDAVQVQAIAQTRMGVMRQSGDLLEFILEFDDVCSRAGLGSDTSKITLLLPKLQPRIRDMLFSGGDTLVSYSTVRSQLLNIYSRLDLQKTETEGKRKKAKCKVCGKTGHTGAQCRSAN